MNITSIFTRITLMSTVLTLACVSCLSCVKTIRYDTLSKTSAPIHKRSIGLVTDVPILITGTKAAGTVFPITKDLFLTAGHVCKRITERYSNNLTTGQLVISTVDKKGHPLKDKIILAQIVNFVDDGTLDICLLEGKNHGLVPIKMSKYYDLVETGDSVYKIGCPNGVPYVVGDGRIISVTESKLHMNLFVEKGDSGSPVFWQDKLIGMVISYPNIPEGALRNTSYAIGLPELIKFLESNGVYNNNDN
jgi:hypothetical protein